MCIWLSVVTGLVLWKADSVTEVSVQNVYVPLGSTLWKGAEGSRRGHREKLSCDAGLMTALANPQGALLSGAGLKYVWTFTAPPQPAIGCELP